MISTVASLRLMATPPSPAMNSAPPPCVHPSYLPRARLPSPSPVPYIWKGNNTPPRSWDVVTNPDHQCILEKLELSEMAYFTPKNDVVQETRRLEALEAQ